MYNKLLISAGGGIISRDQQAEQNECAVIAIGLGGTGISALRSLKKEVYDRLKPDKADSTVPSYSHIKFWACCPTRRPCGAHPPFSGSRPPLPSLTARVLRL